MKHYHKIHSIYKRDGQGKFIIGEWSCPEFEYLQNNLWEFTEKVDGTNIRIMFDGTDVTFGGKTDNASIPSFLVTRLNNLFMTLEQRQKFKENFAEGVCFYGEGYGERIQKGGGNYCKGQDFVLFDIRIGEYWLKRENCEVIAKLFGIDIVPIFGYGTIHEAIKLCQDGLNSNWGAFEAEGIVLRPKVALLARNAAKIITKVKCKDFKTGG